jgi:hypothetical protein
VNRQPRWLPSERWLPGACVSAGGATTGGEKLFGPPGVMFFSVGDGATVVVVVVVVDGVGSSLVLQPAVSAPIAMIAPPPATNASRRAKRPEFMLCSNLIPELVPISALRVIGGATLASIYWHTLSKLVAYCLRGDFVNLSGSDACQSRLELIQAARRRSQWLGVGGSGSDVRGLGFVESIQQCRGNEVVGAQRRGH